MRKILLTILTVSLCVANAFAMRFELLKRWQDIEWRAQPQDRLVDYMRLPDGNLLLAGTSYVRQERQYEYRRWWLGISDPAMDTLLFSRVYGRDDRVIAPQANIRVTSDGGYLLYGKINRPPRPGFQNAMLKVASNGDSLWYREYPSYCVYLVPCFVSETSDGGFYVVSGDADTALFEGADFIQIYKTDSLGEVEWEKQWGIGFEHPLHPYSTLVLENDDLLISGTDWTFGAPYENGDRVRVHKGFALRLDSNSEEIWFVTYRDTSDYSPQNNPNGWFSDSIIMSDSSLILGGGIDYSYRDRGEHRLWLVSLADDGSVIWDQSHILSHPFGTTAVRNIFKTQNGSILGFASSTIYREGSPSYSLPIIALYDSVGEQLDTITGMHDPPIPDEFPGSYGGRTACDFGNDEFLFRLDRDFYKLYLNQEVSSVKPVMVANDFFLYPAYPNPFNSQTQMRYYLPDAGRVTGAFFDLSGREIARQTLGEQASGYHVLHLDGSGLASGAYIIRLNCSEGVTEQKVILTR